MKGLRFWAILAGLAVDHAGSFLATLGVIAPFVIPLLWEGRANEISATLQQPLPIALCALAGTAGSITGGWVAGRMSRRQPWNPLWNAGVVAGIGIVIDLCVLSQGPSWYKITGIVVSPLATMLGGWIAARKNAPSA